MDNLMRTFLCAFTLLQEAGKYRQEGKGYMVNDGDIIHFLFNPKGDGKGGKK